VRITGSNFVRAARLPLGPGEPELLDAFTVALNALQLDPSSIRFIDANTLEVTVPAGLEPGPRDVTVTTPAGDRATLPGGLTVVPLVESQCRDGIDDDLDLLVDCEDPDCPQASCLEPDAGPRDAGAPDAGQSDAGGDDAGAVDAGEADDGGADAGTSDAGTADAGTSDAGTSDAGTSDAGTSDAGTSDAGTSDAGTADAGTSDAGAAPDAGAQSTNTPPLGCLRVSPASVPAGGVIVLDATCSRDEEDPAPALSLRFHLGGDAGLPTSFGPLQRVAQTFSTLGVFTVTAEVRDDGGLSGYASRVVVITAGGASEVVVTTPDDETLPNGTTSLREAITAVNAGAVPRTIRFDGGMTVLLNTSLPALTVAGTQLVGGDGVTINFKNNSGCLSLNNSNQTVVGLELLDCSSFPLSVSGLGAHIADTIVRPGLNGSTSQGVRVLGDDVVFGPGNEVVGFSSGTGVNVSGQTARLIGSRISGNATGVSANAFADGIQVYGCVFTANTSRALYLTGGQTPGPVVVHNTFHGNRYGVESNTGPTTLVNNLFTSNTDWAVWGGSYAAREPNGYFANGGNYNLTSSDAGMIEGDPRFFDAGALDLRLRPGSVMIDRGVDAGFDTNGAGPGLFFGAAPDLGAFESP